VESLEIRSGQVFFVRHYSPVAELSARMPHAPSTSKERTTWNFAATSLAC